MDDSLASPEESRRLTRIAHRGYSEKYPENTLLAFEKAIEAGADMIELDVHLSRDGQLVVIHDSSINRTSDGRGRVAGLTLAELKRYNYNNGMVNAGFVEIPTLEEVIDRVDGRAMLNIEIKRSRAKHGSIEEGVSGLIKRKALINRVIVSSFDHHVLSEMKRFAEELKTGMLYERPRRKFREEVMVLGVSSVHPAIDAIDAEQLLWAKSCGLLVYPWVARDREALERCRSAGFIDGVMVNDLELFDIHPPW